LDPLSAETRESFCGVHACCNRCAAECAKQSVRMGRLPECFEPECRHVADPFLVTRLLTDVADQERYLALALWSNPRVEACPRCHCLLYADSVAPSQGCGSCPSCSHAFCVDCRCPKHDGETCEAALAKEHSRLERLAKCAATGKMTPSTRGDSSPRPTSATPRPRSCLPQRRALSCCACSGTAVSPAASQESRTPSVFDVVGELGESGMKHRSFSFGELESAGHAAGFKCCPRCRVMVEKSGDGCEHMRCWQCGFEFCWLCLADRAVIYAHGNHYHRPNCRLYAAYSGPDAVEYLPKRCQRCALRGSACQAPRPANVPMQSATGMYYSALVDACTRWFQHGLFFSSCATVQID